MNFTDWGYDEPNTAPSSTCIAVSLANAMWSAQHCEQKKPFICVFSNTAAPATTTSPPLATTTTLKPSHCDEGWKFFETTGFCYKAFSNLNLSSEESEKHCIANGAHLASIHSRTEDDFVAGSGFTFEFDSRIYILVQKRIRFNILRSRGEFLFEPNRGLFLFVIVLKL